MISLAPPRWAPSRIVSLVPSLTEALFLLGLGERVVGVTDWCVHPAREVACRARVGGTRSPDLSAILSLRPDLVVANREENRRRDVEALAAAGVFVWVTYPRTVPEAVGVLEQLAGLGAPRELHRAVVDPVRERVQRALAERAGPVCTVFCPIWKGPWMAVGRDTYAHDLLELCGAANVFADRGDRRYPRVTTADIVAARPELVLLPDEPYAFTAADSQELRELPIPAAETGRIHTIDGTLVAWYGPRIARAIDTLRSLIVAGG